jgi:hypothetical protein
MPKVSRSDKVIAAVLVVVLAALVVVAAVHQAKHSPSAAGQTSGATPTVASSASGSPPVSPSSSAGGTSTAATPPSTTTTPPSTTAAVGPVTGPGSPPVAGPVTAIGDSIMLDIQPDLQADIPGARVDGLVSRQFETGIGIVQADRAAGTLGNVLVVELGTNGSVTSSDFDAMMQAASGVRRVVFVNVNVPRPWEPGDNATLAAGVARYPGVAMLADWNALSTPHPDWFTPDQVHLQPAGAQALAALITRFA